jgi:hypothetical protein
MHHYFVFRDTQYARRLPVFRQLCLGLISISVILTRVNLISQPSSPGRREVKPGVDIHAGQK